MSITAPHPPFLNLSKDWGELEGVGEGRRGRGILGVRDGRSREKPGGRKAFFSIF